MIIFILTAYFAIFVVFVSLLFFHYFNTTFQFPSYCSFNDLAFEDVLFFVISLVFHAFSFGKKIQFFPSVLISHWFFWRLFLGRSYCIFVSKAYYYSSQRKEYHKICRKVSWENVKWNKWFFSCSRSCFIFCIYV